MAGITRSKVIPMICGSRGSKSNLARAAGAEPSGQMRNEKLHAVVARSTFQVKMYKPPQLRKTLKVEMSKSVRCCGAKHISK